MYRPRWRLCQSFCIAPAGKIPFAVCLRYQNTTVGAVFHPPPHFFHGRVRTNQNSFFRMHRRRSSSITDAPAQRVVGARHIDITERPGIFARSMPSSCRGHKRTNHRISLLFRFQIQPFCNKVSQMLVGWHPVATPSFCELRRKLRGTNEEGRPRVAPTFIAGSSASVA